MSKEKSIKFLQTRKLMTFLPVLVFPFLCLVFWSLDGGKGGSKNEVVLQKGINFELPEASIDVSKESTDKMSIYNRAQRDSSFLAQERERDKMFNNDQQSGQSGEKVQDVGDNLSVGKGKGRGLNYSPIYKRNYVDPNEAKVNEKLDELYRGLSLSNENRDNVRDKLSSKESNVEEPEDKELAKLNKIMESMGTSNDGKVGKDSEIEQMNGVLEKLLDAQHPERVKERLKQKSEENKGVVFPVSMDENDIKMGLIKQSRFNSKNIQDTLNGNKKMVVSVINEKRSGFFGLVDAEEHVKTVSNAIQAVVHTSQTLVSGSVVKMRLITDVFINGQRIPKDSFIYGFAAISGERLNISVNSIRYLNSIFPVGLFVYDMDGLPGIYIPGAIEREFSKDALASGVQQIDYNPASTSMDPSITQQVAAGVLSGAKGLFSAKTRLNKVNVKANYKILLLDTGN